MFNERFNSYISDKSNLPLLICGKAIEILKELPNDSIDCCITSPPYWMKRQYMNGGIGLENSYEEYINNLLLITKEIFRILKPSGSFWLNIGDTYKNKSLTCIPWRIAITMIDSQKWILRNTVIWNKVKGGLDNAKDKLGNIYEPIFHFVKSKNYYYNLDEIRNKTLSATITDDKVISATGVSGVRYKKQIEGSNILTVEQKVNAINDLNTIIAQMKSGELSDFRMIINGEQRTTHSDSETVSGRAKELHEKGYYFLKYSPKGTKPNDIWRIIPEDTQKRTLHFAPYPEELCVKPITLTCPIDGVVLDPFVGSGTTCLTAYKLKRKSIGIDICNEYINASIDRIDEWRKKNE